MDQTTKQNAIGTLYIVSTPIGNLEDITFRAVRILKEADIILAEDTRITGRLLSHYDIRNRLLSYHSHNEKGRIPQIIKYLQEGQQVALVSDAGTPGISDPAHKLVKAAIQAKILIVPIPGVTAAIPALVASGLPTNRFVFEGFLPVKTAARRKKLSELQKANMTTILYESPHRLTKTLKDIQEVLDDPIVVCARELTKKFEEVKKGRASQLLEHFLVHKPRGEFVVLLAKPS